MTSFWLIPALVNMGLSLLISPLREGECHGKPNSNTCMKEKQCVWCIAGAVPSACYTIEESARLPIAVFTCQSKVSEWEGGDYQKLFLEQ